jgi:hypothetical protein
MLSEVSPHKWSLTTCIYFYDILTKQVSSYRNQTSSGSGLTIRSYERSILGSENTFYIDYSGHYT